MSISAVINPLSTLIAALLTALPNVQADPPQVPIKPAIVHGRITDEAGAPIPNARVRAAIPAISMDLIDANTQSKLLETKSDADGHYRFELSEIKDATTLSLDVLKPRYRRLIGGDVRLLNIVPGGTVDVPLTLKPSLYFAGTVVDEQGKPIPNVLVHAQEKQTRGTSSVERTTTAADGSFELFNYSIKPAATNGKSPVFLHAENYIDLRIDDLRALPENQRETMRIVLEKGLTVSGTVLDSAGKPVPDALIRVTRKDGTHRKATMSNSLGKFTLQGLSKGLSSLKARNFTIKQKTIKLLALKSDQPDLEVQLQPMALPSNLQTYRVLGMTLADVTPEIQSAYDLYQQRGVIVLDPGVNAKRLGLANIGEGDEFYSVGRKRIGSVRELVEQIVAQSHTQQVSVQYAVTKLESDGNSGARLNLTKADLFELQRLADQLNPREP
jgi:protocatechuate 3,4-dioxygenase beta subunit